MIGNKISNITDRGYDFEGVVKWYANRADVVLLFFDPDKPGTTGETLSILTNSLVGMEHKLHIILNKSDQFRKIHDFARAYGSLCWNLSKVIQRKDLPRIYTMCLPPDYRTKAAKDRLEVSSDSDRDSGESDSLGQGLMDLQTSREDVVKEVRNAPKRRIDNEITRLSDSLQLLQMHCKILDTLLASYRSVMWKYRLLLAASVASSCGLVSASVVLSLPLEVSIGGGIGAGFICSGLAAWQRHSLRAQATNLISPANLESTFQQVYARRIAENDEFVTSLWIRVREHLKMGLNVPDFESTRRLPSSDMAALEHILEFDVPALRRKVTPMLNTIK
eukprot:CAMPEP_0182421364 /NCGR_PEP_ID=MMETSP1167-20130531/6726_1 /TAXON_ID=2988 /ORGANISM="Mallomonas Sp, Strain CCMP3275" /LENGTH=333 /DNA_ID=CAMNT_0024598423 /DNA_START=619 /DNA_END=1620 /DNA_ORIENTATION=-